MAVRSKQGVARLNHVPGPPKKSKQGQGRNSLPNHNRKQKRGQG